MSSAITAVPAEFEFSSTQDTLFRDLARKMALVGFALFLFGGLQMVNGIMTFISTRSPEKVLAAARQAGVPEEKIKQLEKALTPDGWFSPASITSIAFALSGVIMIMVGMWTQQAASGFAGVALTKGQDISLLMVALGALYKKYSLMYALLWLAAICSFISLAFSLYHHLTAK
jgi:hypothetical protein